MRRHLDGGPGRSRTADQRFRKPLLYPTELRGRCELIHYRTSNPSEIPLRGGSRAGMTASSLHTLAPIRVCPIRQK